MTIIEQARELLEFAQEGAPLVVGLPRDQPPPYILIANDSLAKVCRSLIQRTEALRELANATERLAMTDDKSALRRACMAIDDARRALADD
jgi:hypothetical protein